MADDSRPSAIKEDLSREALTVDPSQKAFTGAQWQDGSAKAEGYKPPQNANLLAGGTENTAGGQTKDIGLGDAFEAIKLEEFTEIHKKPCVRDALMVGIGSGFGVGGVRALVGGRGRAKATVWTACNWAVGAWVFGSVGMYQYCQYKRQMEKAGMTRAMEILSKKDMEKKAREARKEKMREERRKAKDQDQDVQLAALAQAKDAKEGGNGGGSWWKPW